MSKEKSKFRDKLHKRYRIVIYNNETYEEKVHFQLSRMNFFTIIVCSVVLLIVLTAYIIAFTPLREYIPGYTDVTLSRRIYEMEHKADSLELAYKQKEQYFNNIRRIIMGDTFETDSVKSLLTKSTDTDFDNITIKKSKEDSLFRLEYEMETRNNLFGNELMSSIPEDFKMFSFFMPVNGMVTNSYNSEEKHFGTDLVAANNSIVKSVAEGTVIFSEWTVDNGYSIVIQHEGNLLSVYKHNSVLLKEDGDYVSAGDPIAIFGNSGSLSTGPHLHFELWFNGIPLNAEEYISFETN